jgi:hypothetical protein
MSESQQLPVFEGLDEDDIILAEIFKLAKYQAVSDIPQDLEDIVDDRASIDETQNR